MSYRKSRKRSPSIHDLTYERDMQETIRQAALLHKWPCYYHTYDSRRSPEGLPDIFIAGYEKMIVWEVKTTDGRLTDAQRLWVKTLSEVKGPPLVEVIRPGDLDRCLEILKRRGHG